MKTRAICLAAIALAFGACSAFAYGTLDIVRGNGTVRLESREVPSFTGIRIAGTGLVRFTPGAVRQVTVEADTNILPCIETEVRSGVLVLRTRPGTSINPTRLVFRITAPDLRAVTVAGSGDISLEAPLEAARFDIRIEGSGNVDGELDVDDLSVEIRGSGDVALSGAAEAARFDIGGSGDIEAADLACGDATVRIAGSGSVWVQAAGTLDVNINGSGDVHYRGDAKISVRSSGSGRIMEY